MRILLFCNFTLPDSCADATRVLNLSKLLKLSGHEVELLGVSFNESRNIGNVDGIEYGHLQAGSWTGYKAIIRIIRLKKDIRRFLIEHSKDRPYDAILLSGVYYDYSSVFFKYRKRYGAKLIVNALEWFDKGNVQFDGLRGKINLVKNRVALKHTFVKMKNILVISTLLEKYYSSHGCNTVVIPTVIDMQEYQKEPLISAVVVRDRIHIAYAGNPCRKDYVINAIFALERLSPEELSKTVLDFYGVTTEQMYREGLPGDFFEKYKDNIVCHGRIPYADVKKKIAEADFTVLLRPDKRYANAGFPTKVGESMACGTPVIANITSDLGKYIIDGKTGIICENETPEACAKAFRRALNLTREQMAEMRREALKMAEKSFDYRAYTEAMERFLNE